VYNFFIDLDSSLSGPPSTSHSIIMLVVLDRYSEAAAGSTYVSRLLGRGMLMAKRHHDQFMVSAWYVQIGPEFWHVPTNRQLCAGLLAADVA